MATLSLRRDAGRVRGVNAARAVLHTAGATYARSPTPRASNDAARRAPAGHGCYLAPHPEGDDLTTGGDSVSRAFLRDDAEGEMPRRHYDLPARDHPEFDRSAARVLLEAARVNETQLAERATGYYWGEPVLRPYVAEMLIEAERAQDDRLEQLARRFLG